MLFNNNFKITDTIKLVLPKTTDITNLKVQRYFNFELLSIPYTTTVIGDYRYIVIQPTGVDCYVFISYGSSYSSRAEIVRTGSPAAMVFFQYYNYDNRTLYYQQFDYNSRLLTSGTMSNITGIIYGVLVTNSTESFFILDGRIITYTLPSRYITVSNYMTGTIELERGKWQLISIPEAGKVKDIFLDRLATQEGVAASELFEVVSAYPGNIDYFLTYIPGFTDDTSVHNFDLVIDDNGSKEITGFWVKCRNWQHKTGNIVYSWSSVNA